MYSKDFSLNLIIDFKSFVELTSFYSLAHSIPCLSTKWINMNPYESIWRKSIRFLWLYFPRMFRMMLKFKPYVTSSLFCLLCLSQKMISAILELISYFFSFGYVSKGPPLNCKWPNSFMKESNSLRFINLIFFQNFNGVEKMLNC